LSSLRRFVAKLGSALQIRFEVLSPKSKGNRAKTTYNTLQHINALLKEKDSYKKVLDSQSPV